MRTAQRTSTGKRTPLTVWVQVVATVEASLGLLAGAVAAGAVHAVGDRAISIGLAFFCSAITVALVLRSRHRSSKLWPLVACQALWIGFEGLFIWAPTGSAGAAVLWPLLVCVLIVPILALARLVRESDGPRTNHPPAP
jgi:hypothetical protein